MIKRIRQNKSLRASNRQKFQEDNRATIYAGRKSTDKAIFKKFSKAQVELVIRKIRDEAKLERRKEVLLLLPFIVAILFAIINLSSKDMPAKKDQNVNTPMVKPIEWCGTISDPIGIPNSEYFYVPIVEELDREINLNGSYKITPPNMAGDYTNNILFLDKDTLEIGKLLPNNGWISYMWFGPDENEHVPRTILYYLAEEDTNNDEYINKKDQHYLYISDLNGGGITKITTRPINDLAWVNQGCEIMVRFEISNKATDSLYGFFNIETKEIKLTNSATLNTLF